MRFLKGLEYAVAYVSVFAFRDNWSPRRIVNQKEYQAELAATAGPKTEGGYTLPVDIELVPDPDSSWSEFRVQCRIAGRVVGNMDRDNSVAWHRRVVAEANAGRSVSLPGYVVGGMCRAGGQKESEYKVVFKDYLGDDPQDQELEDLLTLED